MTRQGVDELMKSRMDGEDDVHFYARESRRKIDDFLNAKLVVAKRHNRFMMAGAVQSLYNALKKDGAYPEQK